MFIRHPSLVIYMYCTVAALVAIVRFKTPNHEPDKSIKDAIKPDMLDF